MERTAGGLRIAAAAQVPGRGPADLAAGAMSAPIALGANVLVHHRLTIALVSAPVVAPLNKASGT